MVEGRLNRAATLAIGGALLPRRFKNMLFPATGTYSPAGNSKSAGPKNILIITGSTRIQGNSDLLAEAFAKGARESGHTVNIFRSGQDRMSACRYCDECWSTGAPCVVRDNYDRLWPMLEEAEMLVLCSPLYWYTFSGHIKAAIDRMYAYGSSNRKRDLKIKETMLLMCAQSWLEKSFDGAAESYRQMVGYKGWEDRGRLLVTGVHEKGEIAGNSDLEIAEMMGRGA